MPHSIARTLERYGQSHLLQGWGALTYAERQQLVEQIEAIDFELVARLYQQGGDTTDWKSLATRAEPPPAFRPGDATAKIDARSAHATGEQELAAGRVGVILVAGGQGTRLGFPHPKGMYPIGPVSQAPLFQILCEKVLATAERYQQRVPLYVMTSPATHAETVAFFAEGARFGLPAEDVRFFCQGVMPAVDAATGRCLLAAPGQVSLSPDGHGGMLAALVRASLLADMRGRGIERLFYMQVDNPLVDACGPEFIGYHVLAGSEMSTQVVNKAHPREPLGNLVSVDGRLQIIEYSDLNRLPDEIVERRDTHGRFVFWAGSTAVHVMDRTLLVRAAESATALPFHVARKKVPYVDDAGQTIHPAIENAIKFERFIFDLLPIAAGAIVVEVDAATNFAPLKNGDDARTDTPRTVRAQMVSAHRRWLEAAGSRVADGVQVEVSPRFALRAADLPGKIPPGLTVTTDRYFC